MKLTDDFVRQIAPADSKAVRKYSDGKSLYLQVNSVGKYWRLNYQFAGKRKTLALGVYPAVSIDEARQQCKSAHELLRSGIDPSAARKENRQFQRLASIGPRPRHPGAVLRETLLIQGPDSLPALEGLGDMMNELSPMTCDLALQLEHLLAIKAEKWMALQQVVDLWDAREKLRRMRELGKSLRLDGMASN